MKRILYILAIMLTVGMGASAQTLIERSDGTFTQGDQYLAALKTLSIPYGVAPTFDGGLARNGSLFFNTTTNKLMVWTGASWENVGKDTDLSNYYNKSEIAALIAPFATVAEMNAALATKQSTITGGASSVVSENLTNNRAVISNSTGKIAVSPVTANELSYLGGVTSSVQTQLNDKIAIAQKGANNGVAPLNASGKIPAQYVDVTTMEYMGTWNAANNTPTLADATGLAGQYYRVTVGGTQNLGSGNITFTAGDDVIHNGSIWQRVPSTQLVTSVNGQTGNIVLGKADVGLGNVDNTADLAKPISNATQTALDGKVNLNGSNVTPGQTWGINISGLAGNSEKWGNMAVNWGDGAGQDFNFPVVIDSDGIAKPASKNDFTGWLAFSLSTPTLSSIALSGANTISIKGLTTNNFDWTTTDFENTGFFNASASGSPSEGTNYSGIYLPMGYNYSTQLAFRNNRGYMQSVENGVRQPWLELATREWTQPLLDAKLNVTGGTVTGLITATTAPTAGGHLTNKTYVDNAISTAIAAAGGKAESVTVAATATYTLSWDTAKKAKFGDFGNFEVWLETGGTYKLATVPISMTLSGGAASAYTFTLSNVNAIIVIK